MADCDNDTPVSELYHLVESAIAQRKDECGQLENFCQQLNNGQNMTVSSFEIKKTKENRQNSFELVIKSESVAVLNLWKLALFAAFRKINADYINVTITPNSISKEFNPKEFKKIVQYLKPFAQATKAIDGNFKDYFKGPLFTFSFGSTKPSKHLRGIIETVIEMQGEWTTQVLESWDELKLNAGNTLDSGRLCFGRCERDPVMVNRRIEFGLEFSAPNAFFLWSSCISFALSKLNAVESSMRECPGIWTHVAVNTEDLDRILDLLKPLGKRTRFADSSLYRVDDHFIKRSSEFVTSGSIFAVSLYDDIRTPFQPWLDWVRQVIPTKVDFCRLGLEREAEDFLFPLADLVEIIDICDAATDSPVDPPRVPFAVMRQILSRKCRGLIMEDTSLPLEEADNFVQFFHHLSKVCYLQMQAKEDEFQVFDIQVGEYVIKSISTQFDGILMIIAHQNKRIPDFT